MKEIASKFAAIVRSTDQYPVDFDQAWQWVGYTRKDHALETIKANFEEPQDFSRIIGKSTGGRPAEGYFLTTDCFKAFCMMAGTEKGKEVRKYYLRIEKEYVELRRLEASKQKPASLDQGKQVETFLNRFGFNVRFVPFYGKEGE
jgi:phage anti-repressor protein